MKTRCVLALKKALSVDAATNGGAAAQQQQQQQERLRAFLLKQGLGLVATDLVEVRRPLRLFLAAV
jgi:hypothetical protein